MLAYTQSNPKSVRNAREAEKGFTLIELSIVLVIIGLIVGGVLVGQDLIRAAEVRATITQIEKYNTAVNTFRVKFNALPGDMASTTAATFGFTTRAGTVGQGDGNGLIDGEAAASSLLQGGGETGLFWVDLSSSVGGNLIDGGFTSATGVSTPSPANTGLGLYIPPAKLGRGNYIYVFNGNGSGVTSLAGYNWYGMANVSGIAAGVLTATGSVTVIQAYNIDKKVDDGYPLSGNVQAAYVSASAIVQAAASTASSTSCYDTSSTPNPYSIATNNGAGGNCALTFKFQ